MSAWRLPGLYLWSSTLGEGLVTAMGQQVPGGWRFGRTHPVILDKGPFAGRDGAERWLAKPAVEGGLLGPRCSGRARRVQ